jgi:hypothetical protein
MMISLTVNPVEAGQPAPYGGMNQFPSSTVRPIAIAPKRMPGFNRWLGGGSQWRSGFEGPILA